MFKHILVPLDGSKLAETALPSAALLAEKVDAMVTLIHVIEANPPQEIHGQAHLSNSQEAQVYLDRIKKESFPDSVLVDTHVHTESVRDVSRSIVEHTSELKPDLIVMCSHGEGGLVKWIVGSIAQRVIGHGQMPILMIQPDQQGNALQIGFTRFIIALDGDLAHEQGLEVAGNLAMLTGAAIHLVSVVQNLSNLHGERAATGRLLPVATQAMLDITEKTMQAYLSEKASDWGSRNISVSGEILRGEPAKMIVESAESQHVDLIVLGTHGKAGIGAFWAGSVAPQIVASTRLPILLVPVHRSAEKHSSG